MAKTPRNNPDGTAESFAGVKTFTSGTVGCGFNGLAITYIVA